MTKSQANKEEAVDGKLLTLPVNAGRARVEAGAVIACHYWERIDVLNFVANVVFPSPERA